MKVKENETLFSAFKQEAERVPWARPFTPETFELYTEKPTYLTTIAVSVFSWSIFTMYWPQIAFFALIGKE